MSDLRVATAFCLTGLVLAASIVQDTDHREQSHTVKNREIHKQLERQRIRKNVSYRRRGGTGKHDINMHNIIKIYISIVMT